MLNYVFGVSPGHCMTSFLSQNRQYCLHTLLCSPLPCECCSRRFTDVTLSTEVIYPGQSRSLVFGVEEVKQSVVFEASEGDSELFTLQEWEPSNLSESWLAQRLERWKRVHFWLGWQLGCGVCLCSARCVGVLCHRPETLQWELQPPCSAHLAWPLILKFTVLQNSQND